LTVPAWEFFTAKNGWSMYSDAEAAPYRMVGGVWASVPGVALDVANRFTKNQHVAPVVLPWAATVTPDASASNVFSLTLAGATTLANPTNLQAGMVLNFDLDQDATGAWAILFDTMYKFPDGAAPVFVTTAGAKNSMVCRYDGTILRCEVQKGFA
jgi:hypothetical protein